MKKKPLSVQFIALGYGLAPLMHIIQLCWVNHWPVFGPRGVLAHLSAQECVVLSLFPVVAFGIFRVTKWGFYLFISFSAFLILQSSYMYLSHPTYSLRLVIAFHLLILGVVGWLLQKSIISPFYVPELRWWEHAPRYPTELKASYRLGQYVCEGMIANISMDGCYVSAHTLGRVGDLVWLHFDGKENTHISILCRIAWIKKADPVGFGMSFIQMEKEDRRALKKLLSELRHEIHQKNGNPIEQASA